MKPTELRYGFSFLVRMEYALLLMSCLHRVADTVCPAWVSNVVISDCIEDKLTTMMAQCTDM